MNNDLFNLSTEQKSQLQEKKQVTRDITFFLRISDHDITKGDCSPVEKLLNLSHFTRHFLKDMTLKLQRIFTYRRTFLFHKSVQRWEERLCNVTRSPLMHAAWMSLEETIGIWARNDLLYYRRQEISSLKTGCDSDGSIAEKSKYNLFLWCSFGKLLTRKKCK